MKTTLFYFSGTGNSLVVARHLAKELGDTEIVPMAKAIKGPISLSADSIGIIFPVYMWGMPLMAAEFVKKIKVEPSKYVFGVATCGGMPCATLVQLSNLLNANGVKLAAGFGIQLPGNYTPLYDAIEAAKQEKMFSKEKEKIKEIAGIVKAGKTAKIEKNSFIQNILLSGLLYRSMSPKIPASDKNFYADEKCNSCGICEKVCPAENIKLENGKPVWQHRCEQCLACLHWCPTAAIQYGKKTAGRKRYHHPETKIDDFILR